MLQELEGQKAELEQMLKSLQERKGLHVTHQDQPESFISDHEDSSAEATHVRSFNHFNSFHSVLIEQIGIDLWIFKLERLN